MSGPDLDLEKPNVIGGLDKLVTYFAISAIAVVPTFFSCVVMPWRLTRLIGREVPEGREGLSLAPGAYFPLALMVAFITAAILSTPETLSRDNSYIGPGLAVSVQTAAAAGDVWKLVATIMPLYGSAVFLGLLGLILKPLAGPDWSLRSSIRAAFYVMGTLLAWLILVTGVVDLIGVLTENPRLGISVFPILLVPTTLVILWMNFWFVYRNGAISRVRAGGLSLLWFGLVVALMAAIDFLVRIEW